ncbi:MAG: pyridoxamine 5'-phosphate oxidase, partial [Acidimicrobiia bacterium]
DPIAMFRLWFDETVSAGVHEPNAMVVTTVSAEGRPSARMVLLKGVDERGFVFYTNYESHKAADLADNPRAALLFYWSQLDRQVRVEGSVVRIDDAESDAYFAGRPRGHRIGAWASPQSRPIPDRAALESRLAAVEESFVDAGDDVPRPSFWGGYRVIPDAFEFWVNRTDRLHDRVRYTRGADGSWPRDRLAP